MVVPLILSSLHFASDFWEYKTRELKPGVHKADCPQVCVICTQKWPWFLISYQHQVKLRLHLFCGFLIPRQKLLCTRFCIATLSWNWKVAAHLTPFRRDVLPPVPLASALLPDLFMLPVWCLDALEFMIPTLSLCEPQEWIAHSRRDIDRFSWCP